MAEIGPFRGIRFDPSAVGDLAAVVSPPYDVIGEEERARLEAASPYNVVRLVLPRDEPGDAGGKYTRARDLLQAWRSDGVLVEDPEPALYLYEQRYRARGRERTQRGILAAVSLEEKEGVLPHERTYQSIVEDRLALLTATEANLDPILCAYESDDDDAASVLDAAAARDPVADLRTPDGVAHRLWVEADRDAVETIRRALAASTVVIADGHHRWTTARHYRDARRNADGPGPWDAQLMYLVDMGRSESELLPIHRLVRNLDVDQALARLRVAFRLDETSPDDPEALAELVASGPPRTFGMLAAGRAWLLTLADETAVRDALPADRSAAWRSLDVALLHHLVFDRLLGQAGPTFVHHAAEAARAVERGEASVAFLLAPAPFGAVRAIAEAGEAMPQKSTFFYPKPATGLVIRPLNH